MMPALTRDRQGGKTRPLPATPPNYFTDAGVAARYAKVRPFFHAEVAERLREFAGVERFQRVLDVGCGSGQSSIALAAIAGQVTAIDSSPSMLEQAPWRANISYRLGLAEELNFGAGEFDLVSAGSALHWFDQDRFFTQCRKVLTPAGVLAVYNDHFTAHMQNVSACKRWMRTRFAKRFPQPWRGMRDLNETKAVACGFEIAQRVSFSHLVPFLRGELIAYLLTRSNTLAAIASGRETEQSIVHWLERELGTIVPDGVTGSFIFKCNLWMLRKAASGEFR
jgi:SAM-dependent methyltransferase